MANTKKTVDKNIEKSTQTVDTSSQELKKILEMMESMQLKINSLEKENQQLKADFENQKDFEETEGKVEEYVAEYILPSNEVEETPKKIKVYHMQELIGGTSTVIKLSNTKRKLTKMGQLVTFDIDDFEELVGSYNHYFEKGILALDASHLNYAEMYDLPIYDSKTKAQYNSKILKEVVAYNYEQLQKFYNNLSQNNKVAFLTYWLGQVYEKQDGYYNMEKMRWLNTISNSDTFSAILTELENAERRKLNTKIDADKI
jgi:hypothetical protein